jgi:hypothetical protein
MPALFTRMSSRLCASTVAAMASFTSSSREVSVRKKLALPPVASISPTTAFPVSSFSSATSTLAPSAANSRAMARPIPEPAPVISAAFPSSFIARLLSGRRQW